MLIKDLVWLDEEGKFRNDVQLSHYDDQQINRSLVGCYIFSHDAPKGYLSSVNLLKSIIYSYINPQAHKNRTVVIGQYGHGKSHLALLMANYFGKPIASTEFKTVINRLERAIDNPAQLEPYKEFRKNRSEFLIIRLSGDNPRSLKEQFMQAIEKGLIEHKSTNEVRMPFWQETAKNLLNNLEGEQLDRANTYLDQFSTEVVLLAQDIETYSDQSYRMVVDLFTHLHGVAPNLGGEISMKEVLNWAGAEFCGLDGPLGGILILFDEFSLFIQNQSKRGGAGDLQDLLNGVQDQAGKAVFVAFSQHDPKVIARSVVQGVGLDNLEKELNRIEGQLILYSLMESVIDAYLNQSDDGWTKLRNHPEVKGPLARASNLCMDVFSKRYEDTLRWTPEKFDEIVQKGCFPLHPITTAILCDIKLQAVQQAGNPRTVLGFVERVVRERADMNALSDNSRLNWVCAIELIDYFYNYLPQTQRLLFETAKQNLTADDPEEFIMLLKALLLKEIIPIRPDGQTQTEFLAEVSGLDYDVAVDNLKKMSKANITRYDQKRRINSFMPVVNDLNQLRDILNSKKAEFNWGWEQLLKLSAKPQFEALNIDVKWGHPTDWAIKQYVLTSTFFDDEHLKKISQKFEIGYSGFKEGNRGILIWLLAQTAEEVNELRQRAKTVLDEVFTEEYPLPILVVLPDKPCPELLEAHQDLISLSEFTNEERKEVGQVTYEMQIDRAKSDFMAGIDKLRGDSKLYWRQIRNIYSIVAPKAYRAVVQSRGDIGLNTALHLIFELAYQSAPPEFFTQYKAGQSVLRNAVKSTAGVLIKNKLSTSRDWLQTRKVELDLCDKFLVKSWSILAVDYSIQKPTNKRILQAWSRLDEYLSVGKKDVKLKDILEEFINPPFGYDYNTTLILISAWLGFNALEVKFTIDGIMVSVDEIVNLITDAKGINQFLEDMSCRQIFAITRINLGDLINDLKTIISKAQGAPMHQDEAKELIAELETQQSNGAINEDVRSQAKNAASYLQLALKEAELYDSLAIDISQKIESSKLGDLTSIPNQLAKLPTPNKVLITSPSPKDLRDSWYRQISESIEQFCKDNETVDELTEIGRNRSNLIEAKASVKRVAPELVFRFDKAIDLLTTEEQCLKTLNQEGPIRAEINTMKTALPYVDLQSYRSRLNEINGFSHETMLLRNEKMAQIESAITQLEQYANGLINGVSELGSLQDVRAWNNRYLQSQSKFVDSKFQSELEKRNEIVKHLLDFYTDLEIIDLSSLSNPEDIIKIDRDFDDIRKKYEQYLNNKSLDSMDKIRRRIEDIQSKLVDEALKWSDAIFVLGNKGNHRGVIDNAKSFPAFLPNERKIKILEIVKQAEKAIEKDIVSKIEHDFLQIKDKGIQQECLLKLQALFAENTPNTK